METSHKITADANKYYVPALEKGLDILEALAFTTEPVLLTDLARRLDRTPSELFRLLATLEARGYVNKNTNNGSYTLSLKLYELAHQHLPERNLLEAALVPMEEFARRTNEACHLSVARFGRMVVLREALTTGHIRLSVATGSQLPAIRSSSGRLLLAYQPENVLSAFLASDQDYQALSDQQKQIFLDKLKHIRDTGLSSSENENHVGVRDAAIPVGSEQIGLIAALASTWLIAVSNPVYVDMIVQELRSCAEQINTAMGLSNGQLR